jgi:formylglycine-generating enzyme required for sulfatase activity
MQRTGTKLVDISYDLAAPGMSAVPMRLEVSSDGGTTWAVHVNTLSGDIGDNVTPGSGKTIVWNAGADWPNSYSSQMRFRVTADDGFAFITAGSFTMGLTSGDTSNNAPPVTVTLTSFFLQQKETTKAQWDDVRNWGGINGYTDLSTGGSKAGTHPAQDLSWWDAVKWCNARSEKEELTPVYTVSGAVMRTGTTVPEVDWNANGYRLPTEAEWEKAARGGVSGKRFPWGTDTISHANANFRNGGGESYQIGTTGYHPTYGSGTSPVGSFEANGYGLYDMAGNVGEWCWDWYVANYYTTIAGTTDPRGPSGTYTYRITRGGGWNRYATDERCATRFFTTPESPFVSLGGFRPARSQSNSTMVASSPALNTRGPDISTVVNNMTASQRPGTKLVDITYDLEAIGWSGVAVSLQVSSDAGATWTIPVVTVSGDIGDNVTPGSGKTIVWNAGADWPRNYGTQMRFRVTADDGVTPLTGFSYIPPGSFSMGVTSGDADSTAPPITVTLSGYYMQQTETTKEQWDEIRAWGLNNGYSDLAMGGGKMANHPVHSVSWYDVIKWCNARSEKEGLTPVYTVSGSVMRSGTSEPIANWSANGYRLPTEAEWEKAARGGASGWRYPWGSDTISHTEANYNGSGTSFGNQSNGYHPSYATGEPPYTNPVASFAPNGYGLYDMVGNIWEWCWDWYDSGYYALSNGTTDPRGAASGPGRVDRGDGWDAGAFYARLSWRNYNPPATAWDNKGFRTVRSASDFSYISTSSFTMGNTSGDTDSDAPSVIVTISGFHIQQTEATKAQWDEVRAWGLMNGYTDLAAGTGKASTHPVHTVNWYDVIKWCNARSEKEGLEPCYKVAGSVMRSGVSDPSCDWNANGYRLPTEAEWEKAARGGSNEKRFPWGADTINHSNANYYASSSSASYDTSGYTAFTFHPSYAVGLEPYTSSVGSFSANGFGLFDVSGNVWEWCWDWYASNYYSTNAVDPRGPSTGTYRAVRGGSYVSAPWAQRCSYRLNNRLPINGSNNRGFRVARTMIAPMMITSAPSVDTREPEIELEQLSGTSLVDSTGTTTWQALPTGGAATPVSYVIRNVGLANLVNLGLSKSGTNTVDFSLGSLSTPTLAPGESTTFTVTFAPSAGASGTRSATLQVASNDADENPFDIALSGEAYSTTQDVDNDGMNDWGEYKLRALGYDWQVSQPELVSTLMNSTTSVGLYNQTLYNANRTAGQNDVLNSPNTYSLYTLSQIQNLNVGVPLLQRNSATGEFTLTIGVDQSTNLTNWTPLPMTVPQTIINSQGKVEFRFTTPDNAAFFRLQTQPTP